MPTAAVSAPSDAAPTGDTRQFNFDVVVIGSGPGGYIAAIRAAQLGRRVACVERWRNPKGKNKLGGTCLNVGCIPSKALLSSSEHFESIRHEMANHGIHADNVRFELGEMIARKEAVVEKITGGVEFLFRKNRIEWFKGHGKLAGKAGERTRIEVIADDGSMLLAAKDVIIATGSKPRHPEGMQIDNKIVVDNEGALSFESVPTRLAVVGAGVIGLELGSVWRRLGAEVTILEALPDFLPAADTAIAVEAARQFRKQGLTIHLGATVKTVDVGQSRADVRYVDKAGNAQTLHADKLIACIGRVPVLDLIPLILKRTNVDSFRSMSTAGQRRKGYSPSATSCADPCLPTRPRTRA
jgi:dihydrolipoamide dehydrogenase